MGFFDTALRVAEGVGTLGASEGYRYLAKDGNLLGKDKVTPVDNIDPSASQYGAGNGSDIANQLAAQQAQGGFQAQQAQNAREAGFYGNANNNFDIANAAQMRGPAQVQSNLADKAMQLQALRGTNAAMASVGQTGDYLTALGTRPMGDSYAAAQLAQGQDTAMAQQLSMARSGRSLGSGQAAMNQAMFNNSAINQQTNQAAASARIQEQNAYNQFQAGALGAAGQQYGAAGSLSGQAGQQATTFRTGNENVQLQNAQLGQGQQQINNATTGLYNQLGSQQQTLGMQANQMGQQANQFGQQQAANIMGAQLQANASTNGVNAQINMANSSAENAADASQKTRTWQLIGDGAKGAMAMSDERQKKNIFAVGGAPPTGTFSPFSAPPPANLSGPGSYASNMAEVTAPSPLAEAKELEGPKNPSYAQTYAALQAAYAPSQSAPADVLNHKAGAGAPPSSSQSALLDFMRGGSAPSYAPAPRGYAIPGAQPARQWGDVFNTPQLSPDIARYLSGQAPVAPPIQVDGMVTSDAHSKTRIKELEGQLAALGGGASSPAPSGAVSKLQRFIGSLGVRGSEYPTTQAPQTAALDQAHAREQTAPAIDLRPAQGYSYEYKNPNTPGAAPGRHVGPMAQDLEHTAAAGTVYDTPQGKQVDTDRLTMVNTAALSEQQKKTQALEEQLRALQMPQYAAYDPSLYGAPRGAY